MQNDGDFENVILIYVRWNISSRQTTDPSGLQVIHNESTKIVLFRKKLRAD
jgi:hypothetical protein